MKEKHYPIFEEEESTDRCCEPVIEYAATDSGFGGTVVTDQYYDEPWMNDGYDPGIGPYTMEELNARIDEAEAAIERAEHGDWSDWVTSEEMDTELYQECPWLLQ